MHLVLGLGNPGRKYDKTRHNVGFLVADRLAARGGETCDKAQLGAHVAKVRLGPHDAVIAKPQSFMNLSGQPGASLRGFYKVTNDQIVVVHDEMDIPFGQVRIKQGGGHGGHNGLRDLQARLGDGNFVRVRVGVSRPPPGWDPADYVLGSWDTVEQRQLEEVVDRAADAVEAILRDGVTSAMNVFNTRPKGGGAP